MRVHLVAMPWHAVDVPSLALGILTAVLARHGRSTVQVTHGNLEYVDWLRSRRPLAFGDYQFFSEKSYFYGCGDWVFTSALHDDPDWGVEGFRDGLGSESRGRTALLSADELSLAVDLHREAPLFVEELAGRIAADPPDVLGFTTTFQTSIASLALARAVKRLAPAVRIVFGGANCEGEQGAALHRNFAFVDFVVRGEGELVLPDLLDRLADGGDLGTVPGLCHRGSDGASVANPPAPGPVPPSQLIAPHFDSYFARFERSVAVGWADPRLMLEASRGCWWGERHHCTFCGLNGSTMAFRAKDTDTFRREVVALAARHQVLDLMMVDNILDMSYLGTVLPALADSGHDFRIQCEIKSNLRYDQLAGLARAGVVEVQPGIENLSSRVLSIMDKGVTGCLNVRMLRDADSLGLTVLWNYLYGFPGERDEDYLSVIEQLPALHHLPPPESSGRIVLERFSPYFDRPELGFATRRPAAQYTRNHDLPIEELTDLAFMFDTPPRGIDEGVANRLRAAVDAWRAAHPDSFLTHRHDGESIVLTSRRAGFDWTEEVLTGPVHTALFELLDNPRSGRYLHRELGRRLGPTAPGPTELDRVLDRWRALGLLFEDGGQLVHVVARDTNQPLVRVAVRGG
jgi:ribosomal peptide maturation radical SAM protein 1